MSHETEHAFDDFAVWFENNFGRYPPVDQQKRWEFTVKALQCQALVIAKLIGDIQTLEARGKSAALYLPSGLRYSGDLTKLG